MIKGGNVMARSALVIFIVVAVMIAVGAPNHAIAGSAKKATNKAAQKAAEAKPEKKIDDDLTPTATLIAEYYKTMAQIKQYEAEIEKLESQLNRLDAVIKYQGQIQRKIKMDETQSKESE